MGFLYQGVWTDESHFPTDDDGHYVRPDSVFRRRPEVPFVPEPGRNHLYLAHACPWCHRTAIVRQLKGLQQAVDVSFVDPIMREGGWKFTDAAHSDPLFHSAFAHELYTRADPTYTGRVTVPILWDKQLGTIVCNESRDIVRMFDEAGTGPTLRPPPALAEEHDALADRIYNTVNNGVYRAGFATTQQAYATSYAALFETLDALAARLQDGRPHLMGDLLTEVDIFLFVTLVRFDAVYFGHFKCNRNRIEDEPALQGFLERLWARPAFRETTHLDEIQRHYYGSHQSLNPHGIVPCGPRLRILGGEAP
ncbi:MAG: glutathione S-transferase C-terminal domain-containing protein [Bryobacterales bacterium]